MPPKGRKEPLSTPLTYTPEAPDQLRFFRWYNQAIRIAGMVIAGALALLICWLVIGSEMQPRGRGILIAITLFTASALVTFPLVGFMRTRAYHQYERGLKLQAKPAVRQAGKDKIHNAGHLLNRAKDVKIWWRFVSIGFLIVALIVGLIHIL